MVQYYYYQLSIFSNMLLTLVEGNRSGRPLEGPSTNTVLTSTRENVTCCYWNPSQYGDNIETSVLTRLTRYVRGSMLAKCRASVYDAGPALSQHWACISFPLWHCSLHASRLMWDYIFRVDLKRSPDKAGGMRGRSGETGRRMILCSIGGEILRLKSIYLFKYIYTG